MSILDAFGKAAGALSNTPGVGVSKWHRDWKSDFKHGKAHCRAIKDDGTPCQNKRLKGSKQCGIHQNDKFWRCRATNKSGHRCANAQGQNKEDLCGIHYKQFVEEKFTETVRPAWENQQGADEFKKLFNQLRNNMPTWRKEED